MQVSPRISQHPWTLITTLLLLAGLALTPAALAGQQNDRDITREELVNFDRFLDSHQAIEQDLEKHPELVNDANYIKDHPELKTFLETHPGVREEIRENPRVFVRREERFDKSGRDINRQEVARFDEFLDSHPQITHELAKDPALIKNPEYLQKHPELNDFLGQHPRVRKDITQNPRVFMRAERRYEKLEQKQRKIRERKEARPNPRPRPAARQQA